MIFVSFYQAVLKMHAEAWFFQPTKQTLQPKENRQRRVRGEEMKERRRGVATLPTYLSLMNTISSHYTNCPAGFFPSSEDTKPIPASLDGVWPVLQALSKYP